jgi:hypothetical protein
MWRSKQVCQQLHYRKLASISTHATTNGRRKRKSTQLMQVFVWALQQKLPLGSSSWPHYSCDAATPQHGKRHTLSPHAHSCEAVCVKTGPARVALRRPIMHSILHGLAQGTCNDCALANQIQKPAIPCKSYTDSTRSCTCRHWAGAKVATESCRQCQQTIGHAWPKKYP